VQGRLGPQQTSLHNKHPIRKCELLEAQTLGPQVKWYFNLFEECLSLSIFSLENVKFRLGDPDSVLGEETHIGAGRFLQLGDKYPSVINGFIEYTHLLIGSQILSNNQF